MTIAQPKSEFKVEKLRVKIYTTRQKLGLAAARETANLINQILAQQEELVIAFAAAPSQVEFLYELAQITDLPWSQVIAFQIDEYIGLPTDAPQLFRNFLQNIILDKLPLKAFYQINGNATDLNQECQRYTKLLQAHPIDIACLGIGENAHLAFNDPHCADFEDPEWVKIVELDEITRQQQVNDGCFEAFDDVPGRALTLTIPALLRAKWISCVVPAKGKAKAVEMSLTRQISAEYPASILRTHDTATLYLDTDSASRLKFS